MKQAINTKREKFKWLTALCLCLLCFSLCVSMLAKPTYADEPGWLGGLERLGALRWDDTSAGPKKDSFGDTHADSLAIGGSFEGTGEKDIILGWARYRLDGRPEGNFAAMSGRIACAETSTADAAMRLRIYGDDEGAAPVYTSPVIKRDTKPFEFRVDLRGVKTMKMELVQEDAASGQDAQAFALLSEVMLLQEPAPGLPASLHKLIPLESSWVMAPVSHKDSFGNAYVSLTSKLGGTLDTASAMGQARYQLDKKYSVFHGKLACAEDAAEDAVMQVKFYADGSATPFYTSALIRRGTQPFDFSVNVSNVSVLKIELTGTTDPKAASAQNGWVLLINPMLELVPPEPTTTTTAPPTTLPTISYKPVEGWAGVYWQTGPSFQDIDGYIYSFTRNPATDPLTLRVYAKNAKSIEDVSILKYFGAFNGADLVLTALQGVSYPQAIQSVEIAGYTFPVPSTGSLMVHAQDRVRSLAEAFAQNILRSEHIAAIAGIFNSAAAPSLPTLTDAQALKIKEDILRSLEPEFYVNALNNNVYVRLNRDGTADFNAAGAVIWAGADGIIGTADDKVLVLREGSFFYEESPGVWKFVVSRYDYVDPRWATIVAPTTTAAPTTTVTGSIEPTTTTTNGFLTTGDADPPPKTGVPLNAGLFVCVAALFMGCVYCGYRLFKKERA